MSSSFITGIVIFVIAQSVVAANLVFTLRREREANGKIAPAKLLLALLPMLVVDAMFIVWLLGQLNVF
jgi:protein-S-isoprenylcysteine O-methyltransferase Ste14